MKCPEVRQQIFTFLDGEPVRQDEQGFYKHLSCCGNCSKYLEKARHTNRLLENALVYAEPPEDFVQELMLRLPENVVPFPEMPLQAENSPPPARKTWRSRLTVPGAFRNGIAASVAAILLIGGLSFSGGTAMGDSLARRVFVASREGFRRVVDNVFNFEKKDVIPTPTPKNTKKNGSAPANTKKDADVEPEVEKEEEKQPVVALNQLETQGQEQRVLQRPKKSKEEARAEVFSTVGDSMPILAAVMLPVAVNDSVDNARPLWVSSDKIYYLSENRSPQEGTFIIWETDPKGSSRKVVGSKDHSYTLENGGGVWSPSYNDIAFVTNKEGYWEIDCINLKGQVKDVVTPAANEKSVPYQGALWEYNPQWSSQGEIAFLTSRFRNTDIMTVNNKGELKILTKTPEIENNPVWSPDGERLAYYRFTITGKGLSDGKVFVADKDSGETLAITPEMSDTGMIPSWSPDGSRIAVNLYSQEDPEKNGIWTVNDDGSDWKQVSKIGGGKIISWSPDGDKIAFTDTNGQLLVLELPRREGGTGRLILCEPTDQNGEVESLSWSPDSKQLLLEWKGGQNNTTAIWRAELPR